MSTQIVPETSAEVTNKSNRTLHERVQTGFLRTPSGKIYERDIKDIFSLLMICLKLDECSNFSKVKLNPLHKLYPFTFYLDKALETMQNLKVCVEQSSTTTSISYSINRDLSLALVKKFYEAKLIHSAAQRTRAEPKHNVPLQPTPKGVALLHSYCKRIGMKNADFPPILKSNFNSMNLVQFDRDPVTDRILYSEHLIQLLFKKMIGMEPNIWGVKNEPDQIITIDTMNEEEAFEFFDVAMGSGTLYSFEGNNDWKIAEHVNSRTSEIGNKTPGAIISPFYHRYFSNPESDSHVQYYVSSVGVRHFAFNVFKTKGTEVVLNNCLSGKAISQWLTDCSDILNPYHAKELGNLLLRYNLIEPILFPPSKSCAVRFIADRDCFYSISQLGEKVGDWSKFLRGEDISTQGVKNIVEVNLLGSCLHKLNSTDEDFFAASTNANLSKILLKEIIKDPGTKFLFKSHLEKEYCSENLDAYLQLRQFEVKVTTLGKLLQYNSVTSDPNNDNIHFQIEKLSNACLSQAYHIYFTYLSLDSPFVLNIDYKLRAKISSIMVTYASTVQESIDNGEKIEEIQEVVSPEANSSQDPFFLARNKSVSTGSYEKSELLETRLELAQSDKNKVGRVLICLSEIRIVFSEISRDIYHLMEVDSYPKFLSSSTYKEILSTVKFSE